MSERQRRACAVRIASGEKIRNVAADAGVTARVLADRIYYWMQRQPWFEFQEFIAISRGHGTGTIKATELLLLKKREAI